MPSRYNVEAIVLKNKHYGEADKIFTLYSKNKGKITAIAKGVRKVSSRRGGNLDTLNQVVLGVSEGKGDFKYITEVQSKKTFKKIKEDLKLAKAGFYIIELVDRLVEFEQKSPQLFDLILKSLRVLESEKTNVNVVVNFFEVSLAKRLGYELSFDRCVVNDKPYSENWQEYKFNLDLGGFVCGECNVTGFPISKTEAKYLNALSNTKVPKLEKAPKRADDLLKTYIKNILDAEPKTLRVFD